MVNFSPFGITLPTNVFCKIRAQFSSIMQNSLQPSSVEHLNSLPKFTCDFCDIVAVLRNRLFFFIRFPNMRNIFYCNHPLYSFLICIYFIIFFSFLQCFYSIFCYILSDFHKIRHNSTNFDKSKKIKKHSHSSLSARMLSL